MRAARRAGGEAAQAGDTVAEVGAKAVGSAGVIGFAGDGAMGGEPDNVVVKGAYRRAAAARRQRLDGVFAKDPIIDAEAVGGSDAGRIYAEIAAGAVFIDEAIAFGEAIRHRGGTACSRRGTKDHDSDDSDDI